MLLAKVRSWAQAHRGRFPAASGCCSSRRLFGCAEAEAADPPIELKFAHVKSVPRAIEKMVRAYGEVRSAP